jgi:predicted nucleotidyltransferase component of viral defense system
VIGKQDILDRVAEWRLRADIIEKDYVLGWVLAAIAQHEEAAEAWVFKGGTCLKKCYFETYRFSEDLDFTLLPEADYDVEALTSTLREITEIAHDLSGITFPREAVAVTPRKDKLGRQTFQAKIGYRGPLMRPDVPRILFDLTRHEPVLSEPEERPVFHPYPDTLPPDTAIAAYSIEELFAEKTRALLERTRPRDLYDVVFLLESHHGELDFGQIRELFGQKCETKGLVTPNSAELLVVVRSSGELRSEWENMLGHQLPALPPFEEHIARVATLLGWIDDPSWTRSALPRIGEPGASVLAPPGAMYWGVGVPLEVLRFAGVNRLLIEFNYKGKHRRAEPYSLRRSSSGDLLLYAWEVGSTHVKAFSVPEVRDLRVTAKAFKPRYEIEFAPAGGVGVRAMARRQTDGPAARYRVTSRAGSQTRPSFILRCGSCGRLFRHWTRDTTLRPHKTPGGGRCHGRRGSLERAE